MRLLTRYVLREVGLVFFVTLASLTLMLMLFGVIKEAAQHGLNVYHIARLIPYLVPNALLYSIPGTILFAVSNVYGRMSSGNEIVAIKSLGISPSVMLWPTIFFAVFLSLMTVWINDIAMSWGFRGVQTTILNAIEDIIYGMLRSQKSYSTKAFSVTVRDVEGKTLVKPIFVFHANADSPQVTITCREAELKSTPGSDVLTLICREGTADYGGTTYDFPDTIKHDIPLGDASKKGSSQSSPSHLALRVLPERIEQQRSNIDRFEQQLAAQAAYQMMTGDFAALAGPGWTTDRRKLQEQWNQLYRLQTEPPRRWANGFSCLCFTLIGAPMAIRLRNSDFLMSFFACFLPILIIYYPLLATGVDRAKAGSLPPYSVWLANLCLVVWGVWLMRKVLRY